MQNWYVSALFRAGANTSHGFAPAIDMTLNNEVCRMQVRRLESLQRYRIAGRQVDHGVAVAAVAVQARRAPSILAPGERTWDSIADLLLAPGRPSFAR